MRSEDSVGPGQSGSDDSTAPVLAIDGPGGSGKGAVAEQMTRRLGWHLLDSGAIYRLLALAALDADIPLDGETQLSELAKAVDMDFKRGTDGGPEAWLAGRYEDRRLRSEVCGDAASRIAALPGVRAALLQKQRQFRRAPGLVADGRDMGTVVFPDAILKVFLTASAAERANRRYKQLKEKGVDAKLSHLLRDIRARDERDSRRELSPLTPADDAIVLDTTHLTEARTIESVHELLAARLGERH